MTSSLCTCFPLYHYTSSLLLHYYYCCRCTGNIN